MKPVKKYSSFENLKADEPKATNHEESLKKHKAFEEFIELAKQIITPAPLSGQTYNSKI